MRNLFYIPVFALTSILTYGQSGFVYDRNGSVQRQKRIINPDCGLEQGASVYAWPNSLVDEPKSKSEKNFKDYILGNYTSAFPKTTLRFCIVFEPNVLPCCKQIEIADSLTIDKKQLDFLIDLVQKYPVFNQVQFSKGEKAKYIIISIGRYKKNELTVGFSN